MQVLEEKPRFFNILQKRAYISGRLLAKTALHIGAGRGLEASESDDPVVKDIKGRPYIPGSSFKGVLRSSLESILHGLGEKNGLWSCKFVENKHTCVTEKEKKEFVKGKNYEGLLWAKSCSLCRLFGSQWLSSRVKIRDMGVAEPWMERLEYRNGVSIHRDKEIAVKGALYDFEAVPPGTGFDFEILVENPLEYELGLLFLGFQQFNEGYAMLGGKTSRGLGKAEIKLERIRVLTAADIISGRQGETYSTPDQIDTWVKECLDALSGKAREGGES